MSDVGYIRLYRKLLDWEWFNDGNTLKLFIYLLLTAYFKPARRNGFEIQPGQTIITFRKTCQQIGLTMREFRTSFGHLIATHEVTHITTHHYTLVTITNWASYQIETQKPTQQTARQSTSQRQTKDTPSNKNNVNNEKKSLCGHSFSDFYAMYPRKAKKIDAEKAWDQISIDEELFEKIIAALEIHKRSFDWIKEGGRFIPYPSSWLNGRRWEDDPALYTEADPKAAQAKQNSLDWSDHYPEVGGEHETNN